jgi:hypothetical protein
MDSFVIKYLTCSDNHHIGKAIGKLNCLFKILGQIERINCSRRVKGNPGSTLQVVLGPSEGKSQGQLRKGAGFHPAPETDTWWTPLSIALPSMNWEKNHLGCG